MRGILKYSLILSSAAALLVFSPIIAFNMSMYFAYRNFPQQQEAFLQSLVEGGTLPNCD
jgi:hypothetical protein